MFSININTYIDEYMDKNSIVMKYEYSFGGVGGEGGSDLLGFPL